jgi:hypothetical protein
MRKIIEGKGRIVENGARFKGALGKVKREVTVQWRLYGFYGRAARPIKELAGDGVQLYSLQSLETPGLQACAAHPPAGHRRVDEHIKEMPATLIVRGGEVV